MERITIRSGDTIKAPNEGYTAGSQSIQFGGVAMRQACADVRALFLAQAAKVLGCKPAELSIRDGGILRNGASTGQDYWTLAGAVDLTAKATGTGARKRVADLKSIGESSARIDLPAKVFGEAIFIHDMQLDGMVHARVVRQPNRGATIGSIDENAIRRAAKGPIELVRNGNFLAIIGDDETAVEAAGAARGQPCDLAERRGADADATGGELAAAEAGRRARLRRARSGKSAGTRALRGDFFARLSCARLDLAVLRARALQGWQS